MDNGGLVGVLLIGGDAFADSIQLSLFRAHGSSFAFKVLCSARKHRAHCAQGFPCSSRSIGPQVLAEPTNWYGSYGDDTNNPARFFGDLCELVRQFNEEVVWLRYAVIRKATDHQDAFFARFQKSATSAPFTEAIVVFSMLSSLIVLEEYTSRQEADTMNMGFKVQEKSESTFRTYETRVLVDVDFVFDEHIVCVLDCGRKLSELL